MVKKQINEQIELFGNNAEYEAFVDKYIPKKTTDAESVLPVAADHAGRGVREVGGGNG